MRKCRGLFPFFSLPFLCTLPNRVATSSGESKYGKYTTPDFLRTHYPTVIRADYISLKGSYFCRILLVREVTAPYLLRIRPLTKYGDRNSERQVFSEYFIRTFYEDYSICHHSYFRRIFRRIKVVGIDSSNVLCCNKMCAFTSLSDVVEHVRFFYRNATATAPNIQHPPGEIAPTTFFS